jgi:hypothetical protein
MSRLSRSSRRGKCDAVPEYHELVIPEFAEMRTIAAAGRRLSWGRCASARMDAKSG